MKRVIAPAALLALCAQSVCAQCDWSIDGVPDFDQRRRDTVTVQGLPADGGMYCVPTSALNWFAYFANRGIEQPATLDGPRDWEAAAQYDRVTDIDLLMGSLMATDPAEGTGGGMLPGAKAYTTLFAGGDIIVSASHVWGGGEPPTPEAFKAYVDLGGYVQTAYGRYGASTGGTRGGGHAVVPVGMWGCGGGGAPILIFRDPADDPANITQSKFRNSLAALTRVTGQFRPGTSESYESKTMYRLDITDAGTAFLDSVMVYLPAAALFGSGLESAGEIKVVRPVRPDGNPMPLTQSFNKPAGAGRILDAAFDADMRWYYYITAAGTQAAGVWRLDPVTGESRRVVRAAVDPRRLALGRFHDLYVIEGGDVKRYDLSSFPAPLVGAISPTFPADAIAYNDVNDTVVILTEPALFPRRVISVPRSLSGLGTNRSLPGAMPGEGFIVPDPEESGAYWVCSDESPVVRRVVGSGTSMVETDSINHAPGARITGLNMTDGGSLVYALNGKLVELVKSTRGIWINRPDSRWAGRTADGSVAIARSRTNWDKSVMDGPAFHNTPTPVLFPSQPDCIADCDGSGALDFFDFLCFQNQFAAGDLSADCDLSWRLDFFDFLCFQDAFASGCK